MSELHPWVAAAARGVLPDWAVARKKRRAHMARVAALLREWAEARCDLPQDVERWTAVGYLHDALRDADPAELRAALSEPLDDLPREVIHGPAVADRLRLGGVRDEPLLTAIAFHTLGSPDFDDLGKALYVADFLEPGRKLQPKWRARLRGEMPTGLDSVVQAVVGKRIQFLIKKKRPVPPETLQLWNVMAKGREWASASEV
jgi:2-amino-4-hydroxy-6-hydroxymethyldihydropteridine diphosphokinase